MDLDLNVLIILLICMIIIFSLMIFGEKTLNHQWNKMGTLIKNFFDFYFKKEKILISGKVIKIIKTEFNMPLFPTNSNEDFSASDLSTRVVEYIVKIENDEGKIFSIDFDIDETSFDKLGLNEGSVISDLPCRSYKYNNLLIFKNIPALGF
jgi:hypothetical protein